jgi:hypothetical protein
LKSSRTWAAQFEVSSGPFSESSSQTRETGGRLPQTFATYQRRARGVAALSKPVDLIAGRISTSVDDLARKLRRYIRQQSRSAKQIKCS